MGRIGTALLATALVAAMAVAPAPAAGQDGRSAGRRAPDGTATSVVYLVRHAETSDDDPADPTLSDAGRARARRLATVLSDAGIERIHSTPFRRTMGTARPVAEALALEIHVYDPRDPGSRDSLLAQLRDGGRHLVVGHSNTTPAMVRALGADPGAPIREDEHDRLYVVFLSGSTATSALLHYGELPASADSTSARTVRSSIRSRSTVTPRPGSSRGTATRPSSSIVHSGRTTSRSQ